VNIQSAVALCLLFCCCFVSCFYRACRSYRSCSSCLAWLSPSAPASPSWPVLFVHLRLRLCCNIIESVACGDSENVACEDSDQSFEQACRDPQTRTGFEERHRRRVCAHSSDGCCGPSQYLRNPRVKMLRTPTHRTHTHTHTHTLLGGWGEEVWQRSCCVS